MSTPPPDLVTPPVPVLLLITPEIDAKSRPVLPLSSTWMVRLAPLRLMPLTHSTSAHEVLELRISDPVPLPMAPAPQLTVAPVPPRLTVSLEVLAAKPPLLLVAVPAASDQATCPAPVPTALENVPEACKTPPFRRRALEEGKAEPSARRAPAVITVGPS